MAVLLLLAAIVACCLVICLVLLAVVTVRARRSRDDEPMGGDLVGDLAPSQIHRYQLGSLPPGVFKVHRGFQPSVEGDLPSIDSVVVSPFGLFVLTVVGWGGRLAEVDGERWEHDNGWWTRRRPSPVPGARRAAAAVASQVGVPADVVHPIVCLSHRSAEFDGDVPETVVRSGDLARHLRSYGPTVLEAGELERVDRLLAEHVAAATD